MTRELLAFKNAFEAKPHYAELEERVKDHDAEHLFKDLAFQCDTYSLYLAQQDTNKKMFPELKCCWSPTLDIHDVSKKSHYFRIALRELERLDKLDSPQITMEQLKELHPVLYYRACFELYTAIHHEKKPFTFLRF